MILTRDRLIKSIRIETICSNGKEIQMTLIFALLPKLTTRCDFNIYYQAIFKIHFIWVTIMNFNLTESFSVEKSPILTA